MRSYNPMDILGEIMVYFEATENKPQNQLVRMVFDKVLFLAAYGPLAVGCLVGWVLFAITFIAVVPLFIAALGITFVSDAIAISLANVNRTIKHWTSKMWCKISDNSKNPTTYQLPTTNTPLVSLTPKHSSVSSLASNGFIEKTSGERKSALHGNPTTTITYILSDPAPVFPSPCAEIRCHSRERLTSYGLSSSSI
ncbi:hypothetical protein ABEW05_005826 [Botrytis cinerea]